jgi:hypothetical protein
MLYGITDKNDPYRQKSYKTIIFFGRGNKKLLQEIILNLVTITNILVIYIVMNK